MAKKKVVKKQPAKKPTQTQTQNVNVYYGTKPKGKGKSKRSRAGAKPRKESKTISAFNPPPIINFPPQYKPYAVYPEGETAKIFNLNSAVPVPLKIETEAPLLNAPIPEPNLTQIVAPPPAIEGGVEPLGSADDISVLTAEPEFVELPEEAVIDLPPAEVAALVENKEPLFDPFNLPVSASARSLAESIAEPPSIAPTFGSDLSFTPQFSEVGVTFGRRRAEPLPPIGREPVFLQLPSSSGLTLPEPPLAAAEKTQKIEGFTAPLLKKEEDEQRTASGKKIRGPNLTPAQRELKRREEAERKKAERKEKRDREKGESLFASFPTTANVEPLGIPLQIGQKEAEGFKYSAPLSQLEGQYQFIGQPKPPTEKETNPLERRRTGGVLSAAEEAIIGGIPAFIA